ncbi:MAG TPA: zf-HC2 domain-containing protein [Bryobacteraceae bacterium]|jgi:hypothetical protein
MPCEKFEDLLCGYSDLSAEQRQPVDAHMAACADCREFLGTLSALDRSLTTLYAGLQPARPFNPASIRQPSALPEILDFVGWAAVFATLLFLSVVVAARFGYTLTVPRNAVWYTTAALMMLALVAWVTSRRPASPSPR